MCVEIERGYLTFLKSMGIFRKITDLFAKKQKIEKEITTLQNSCSHRKKSVKQIRERLDSTSFVLRYVCNECSMVLGYPNQQEKDNFFKE